MAEHGNPRLNLNDYRLDDTNDLRSAVNAFLLDCVARGLTRATLRYYWQRLTLAAAFLETHGVTDPQHITPALLRAFLADFRARGLSPAYTHQNYRCIRRFCNFLAEEGTLPASPMEHVKPPRLPKDVLPPFDAGEVARLLAASEHSTEPPRDTALLLVLLDSGVRANELLNLNVADMNLSTGAVRVRLGKGQKDRTTYIGARTRKALTRYLASREDYTVTNPLFVTVNDGKRLTFYGLASLLRRLGKRAGVAPMGCHRFRRTFAIECLRAGMPLPQLAGLMGHEGLAVLQRYLRIVDNDLAQAHAQHGPVDSLLSQQKGR